MSMTNLPFETGIITRQISAENPTGEKGMGGRATLENGSAANAARELGQGWKVNPFIVTEPHSTTVLADVKGQGAIKHIWITDSAKNGRLLILKIYFDLLSLLVSIVSHSKEEK